MIFNFLHHLLQFIILISTVISCTSSIMPISIFYESEQYLNDISSLLPPSTSISSYSFNEMLQFPTTNTILIGNSIPKHFNTQMIVDLISKGSNLLWIIPSNNPSPSSIELAHSLGRNLYPNIKAVIGDENQFKTPFSVVLPPLNAATTTTSLFSFFPHSLIPSNSLVFPVLHSSNPHLFSSPSLRGDENVFISALQARPSQIHSRPGRSILINSSITSIPSSVIDSLLNWTFGNSGVKELVSLSYWTGDWNQQDVDVNKKQEPRIGELLSIKLEMTNFPESTPFLPEDLFIELTMMDTWVRAKMIPHNNSLIPSLDISSMSPKGSIRLPSRYGIYQLRIHYDQRGICVLGLDKMNLATTNNIGGYYQDIVIRDFHHNEKERFWIGAIPYYSSLFVNIIISVFMVFPLLLIEKKRIIQQKMLKIE